MGFRYRISRLGQSFEVRIDPHMGHLLKEHCQLPSQLGLRLWRIINE
jgi:hypothetical protein